LSKNELGHDGAVAVGELLDNDNNLLYLDLVSGALLDNDNDLLYLDLSGALNAAIVVMIIRPAMTESIL